METAASRPCPAGRRTARRLASRPGRTDVRRLPVDRTWIGKAWLGRAAMAAALTLTPLMSLPAAAGPVPGTAAPLRIGLPPAPPPPAGVEARLFTDEGFERALARDLGKALGRPVELVTLSDAAPTGGAGPGIDLSVQRGDDGGAGVLGTGYASALTVSMRTDTDIRDWAGLAGRIVCVSETNAAARALAEELGAELALQRAPALSLMRVRTGECDAAIHDAAPLGHLLADPEWEKFSTTLPPRHLQPLTVTVASGDPALATRVAEALTAVASPEAWEARKARWARNVAFEVWLEQEAPDCH